MSGQAPAGSLRRRLLLAFAGFAAALLIALGAGMFVILRDLHRDAASAGLADAMVPLVVQARARLVAHVAAGELTGLPRALSELRDSQPPDSALLIVRADGRVIGGERGRSDAGQSQPALPERLDLEAGQRRGDLTRGVFALPDGRPYVYAATTIVGGRAATGPRALVLARPDDSAALAFSDLVRALAVTLLIVLAAGLPLALWLARSITRPLDRLAAAARTVAAGELPAPLDVDGPREVARVTESFNAMSAEVTASRQVQAQLLANLRHDLRTPLTVIAGFAQALLDGTARDRDARRAAARTIADETRRLEAMVEDLAKLADPAELAGRLRVEELDARSLIDDAAGRFAGRAAARGQTIEAVSSGTSLRMVGDRAALDRVLDNLVANALDAAPAPGGHAWIEAAPAHRGSVALWVRDDGPGIPAAALPRVFERFFRVDPSRAGDHSGLGLAIVDQIARAHGGRAFADDVAGAGARVGVLLPTLDVERIRVRPLQRQGSGATSGVPGGRQLWFP